MNVWEQCVLPIDIESLTGYKCITIIRILLILNPLRDKGEKWIICYVPIFPRQGNKYQ